MRTALICLLLALALAQNQLNYLGPQDSSGTVEELIERSTELQPELYKKVFQHFIVEKMARLKNDGLAANAVREKVRSFLTESAGPLLDQLSEYMRNKLFNRLGR